METLTVSKAKAGFSRMTRQVIKTRRPVLVRTPAGYVLITAYDLPVDVAPAAPGTLKLSAKELELHNTFGESL